MFTKWKFWTIGVDKLSKLKYYLNGNFRAVAIIKHSVLTWKDK